MRQVFIAFVLGIMGLGFLAGCETVSSQHFVSSEIVKGEKKYFVSNRKILRGGAIQGSDVTTPVWQRCPIEALDGDSDRLDETQCVTEHDHFAGMTFDRHVDAHSTTLPKTIIPAAAIGAGIGAGLAHSGSDSVQNNTQTNDVRASTVNPLPPVKK